MGRVVNYEAAQNRAPLFFSAGVYGGRLPGRRDRELGLVAAGARIGRAALGVTLGLVERDHQEAIALERRRAGDLRNPGLQEGVRGGQATGPAVRAASGRSVSIVAVVAQIGR